MKARPGPWRRRLLCDARGATFVECLMIVGLVALVGMVAWKTFGGSIFGAVGKQGACVDELGADGNRTGCAGPGGGTGGPLANNGLASGGTCAGGVCGGGYNCFVAGTPVATAEGSRRIEQVRVGDTVLARDEKTGVVAPSRVTRTFVTPNMPIVDVRVREAPDDVIRATPGHRFWTADRRWVGAEDLEIGEELRDVAGEPLHVDGVLAEAARETVFNFEVEETHTYFVGAARVWVHNPTDGSCGGGFVMVPEPAPASPSDEWEDIGPQPKPQTVVVSSSGPYTPPPGPTNPNVLGGHGGYDPKNTTFQVPPNTSITFPTWHNGTIPEPYAQHIESGGHHGKIDPVKSDGAHTYGPGDHVPDYTLYPPYGATIVPDPVLGYPTTVTGPTQLSTLLKPHMGHVQWASCMADGCLTYLGEHGEPIDEKGPWYKVPAYPPKDANPLNYPTPPRPPPLTAGSVLPNWYAKPPTTNTVPSPPSYDGEMPPPRPSPWWKK